MVAGFVNQARAWYKMKGCGRDAWKARDKAEYRKVRPHDFRFQEI